jgi:DNA-binding NtrC family response regulator
LSDEAILIVNDDPDIAKLFADGLEHAGFRSIICSDSLSAVDIIRTNPNQFALVLIDGTSQQDTDFLNQIKSINNQLRVVLASAFAFIDAEISNSDYDKILQLPVTMSKLVSTVKQVLASKNE